MLILLGIQVICITGALSQSTSGTTTAPTQGGLPVTTPSDIPPPTAGAAHDAGGPALRDLPPDMGHPSPAVGPSSPDVIHSSAVVGHSSPVASHSSTAVGDPSLGTFDTPVPVATAAAPVPDCFWEGRFYKPGTDIVRGQKNSWCYVTYCDSKGQVQFWDDYNCPINSMQSTSGHSSGRGVPPSLGSFSSVGYMGGQGYPGQGQAGHSQGQAGHGGQDGCYHNGHYYRPNEPVISGNIGDMCYGYYCERRNTFVHWEDQCDPPRAPRSHGPIPSPNVFF